MGPPSVDAQPQTFQPALEPAPHRRGVRGTVRVRAVGNALLHRAVWLASPLCRLLAGREAVVPAGNQPVRQHGQGPVAEFADSAVNANPRMVRIMGLPATPSMPDHGCLLAGRTNPNHLAGLAFGVVPCDKYNHGGGEGRFPITARTLSGWPPSLPTESQFHLEEKPHLTQPPLYLPRLAGKRFTTFFKLNLPCFQSFGRNSTQNPCCRLLYLNQKM